MADMNYWSLLAYAGLRVEATLYPVQSRLLGNMCPHLGVLNFRGQLF